MNCSRREILKQAGAASVALLAGGAASPDLGSVEIQVSSVSAHTVRISVLPIQNGRVLAVPDDGALLPLGKPTVALRDLSRAQQIKAGPLRVDVSPEPLAFAVRDAAGVAIQELQFDAGTGELSFTKGDAPVLGLGQGGPQFDRRGSTDRMRSGQGGYQLRTHGGRVPIQWFIGASGWAMYIHQPLGRFDFTGPRGKFSPPAPLVALPLDVFVVVSRDPATIIREYARLTGLAELPPRWSLGYQQSHRTLASREEVLEEAKTFRAKRLPCDTMIYLGTGFCPSGWNTNNGEWEFNRKVFPDPKEMFDQLHADHFKVALHVVIRARSMRGRASDPCDAARPSEEQPSCYWKTHQEIFKLGVDGWWPDEGDPLDAASRLTRNRMYWEAPQLDRPNERPFALHRNGYAGMQRYASFLWSGDVFTTWETLKTHIPVAVNTGLSGIPYWGTDIGGFVPTKEFTAELYLRWFQFGAFCPLFRAHGRTWKLRLPWGWNTGDPGPVEISNYGGAATPDASQLRNPQVEVICRKYLNLRYQLMPYLYSAVRECTVSGLPILRSLWLHYPEDAAAVARGDQYLWGRDILVAPVVEQGAASRALYLPHGNWYDFWTGERVEGGHEIRRPVDLETTPLYVRAGAILPLGPVKQYTEEPVDQPTELRIHPGADGSFLLYDDDGRTFDYRKGAWMGIRMAWSDQRRTLDLRLEPGSRLLGRRDFTVRLEEQTRPVKFEGQPVQVKF